MRWYWLPRSSLKLMHVHFSRIICISGSHNYFLSNLPLLLHILLHLSSQLGSELISTNAARMSYAIIVFPSLLPISKRLITSFLTSRFTPRRGYHKGHEAQYYGRQSTPKSRTKVRHCPCRRSLCSSQGKRRQTRIPRQYCLWEGLRNGRSSHQPHSDRRRLRGQLSCHRSIKAKLLFTSCSVYNTISQ